MVLKINPYYDHISVLLNYDLTASNLVHFNYKTDNHTAGKCLNYIWNWLDENNIEYVTYRFQVNEALISIPNLEDQTLIKLTFDSNDCCHINNYVHGGGATGGGTGC